MEALNWTADYFRKQGIPTPRLDAEILLAHVLGVERIALYTHFDRPLSDEERKQYRGVIKRRLAGEPVSYIRNKKEFWSRTLYVDPRVLIPRPETETVVEVTKDRLQEIPVPPHPRVVDMGCGSGAIALALSTFLKGTFFLVDIDDEALKVARRNCNAYPADGPFFLVCSDLFGAFRWGVRFHVVVSNPPYVAEEELDLLPAGIKDFEPIRALNGGRKGLEILRRLIEASPSYLEGKGIFVTEVGPNQAEEVADLLGETGKFEAIRVTRDLAGHPRVVSGRRI